MKKDMKSKKADKLRGFLCRSADRQYFFRTYNEDGTFTDYNLFHPDLEIQILDSDAYIYKKNGEYCIDCGPQTPGLENEDDYSQQLQYFSKKSEKCDEFFCMTILIPSEIPKKGTNYVISTKSY